MIAKRTIPVEIRLRAYSSTSGLMEATYRPRRTRVTSALLTLLGSAVITPLALLVPPHIPWALGVVAFGGYLSHRRWVGEYLVHALDASCPSCGKPLVLKADQFLRLPHAIPCFNCHQEPELSVRE